MPDSHVIILAAGQGSRMKSQLPKVCHALGGVPMIRHVVATAQELTERITLVVGHGSERVRAEVDTGRVATVEQTEQLGTGHAVLQALDRIRDDETVLILYGDVPLIRAGTLNRLLKAAGAQRLALLTAELDDPDGYGRIVRNAAGDIQAIVEQKDATPEQLAAPEVNTGFMAVPGRLLRTWLPRLSSDNAQAEYYLTDLVAMAVADGIDCVNASPDDPFETRGVNNRVQLAELEGWYQEQRATALMLGGTTLVDPARVDLRGQVKSGQDVVIDSNVILENVVLADNVQIGPNCVIRNSRIAEGAVIETGSVLDGAEVGSNAAVGPLARLRPGTQLAADSKVGNFVEIKKARVETGAKVNHLSYIGDARVGAGANIGAGVITCNYDGANKHHTDIGAGSFVGSNCTLVAPVRIGDQAFVGAGSTLSREAPDAKLTLARTRQKTIDGWKRPEKQNKETRE